MYYKPYLKESLLPLNWLKNITHPGSKSTCVLQGFKCPSNQLCDCEKFCSNGKDFVSYMVPENDRIYVLNQKLSAGAYCLPKGIGNCNLKTSYQIFSRAGWSCINMNDNIFAKDKLNACKNEEAKDNSLNRLYDYKENKDVEDEYIESYYEKLSGQDTLRYRCKCESLSFDNTPMISVFPFMCFVDYCLRDIKRLLKGIGWDGEKCVCGSYPHLNPDDLTSPCRRTVTKIDDNKLVGRVDCMQNNFFVKHSLICPSTDENVIFTEFIVDGSNPHDFLKQYLQKNP